MAKPGTVNKLVKEAAVAAFVRGMMYRDGEPPRDRDMLRAALITAHQHPDLYPGLAERYPDPRDGLQPAEPAAPLPRKPLAGSGGGGRGE